MVEENKIVNVVPEENKNEVPLSGNHCDQSMGFFVGSFSAKQVQTEDGGDGEALPGLS